MLKTFLRVRLIFLTYRLATLKSRTRTFYAIKIKHEHDIFKIEKESDTTDERVLILTLWPRLGILPSIQRVLNQAEKSKVQVICIVNKSPYPEYEIWLNYLTSQKITVITRSNLGRDFGAYRAGFEYLRKTGKLTRIHQLFFINDSTYWFNNSEEILSRFLATKQPWHSLFINKQFDLHAQSFALSFDHSIINSKYFMDYWKSYYPSNERYHAIMKGEMKLSKLLLKKAIIPTSELNPSLISKIEEVEDEMLLPVLNSAFNTGHNLLVLKRLTYLSKNFLDYNLGVVVDNLNPAHHLGILLTRHFGFPLKLDLPKTGLVTNQALYSLLNGFAAEDEMLDLLSYIQSTGTNATRRGIKAHWASVGLIS